MKLLLISPQMEKPNGGIAVWTNKYLEGCKQKNIDCAIVNTKIDETKTNSGKQKRNVFAEYKRTKRIFKDLKKELKIGKFDVAHLNTSIGVLGVIRDYYIAKKINKKGIPIVLHFHCDIPFWVNNKIIKRYLLKILKLSKINFVLCENSKRYLQQTFGVDSIKLPNFVEESVIVDNKIINEEIVSAVFVGRVSLCKGAKEAFEIAKRFPKIEFKFIGELEKEVDVWDKPENCCFLGIQPYSVVLDALDKADMFLFPSHTEGFSMALAEAMARGLPAVATDVGANLDMLENKGGFVVDKEDVDAMEKSILNLMDSSTRSQMSKWSINKVANNYTTNNVMEVLLEQYNSL